MKQKKQTFEPLAIVGMSCLFPKAQTLEDYWGIIKEKIDAISEVPATHWNGNDFYSADKKAADKVYTKNGGFLDAVDFNPAEWGISPSDLDSIDTSQLLSLVVAQGALADAGYGGKHDFNRDNVSVILGLTGTLELVIPLGARLGHPIWRRAMLHAGIPENITNEVIDSIGKSYVSWQENSFPGLLGNVAAGRIANRFDLGGTNCVVDAACGSALSALNLAAMELWAGKSDMAITGGVDTFNDIFMYMCFCKTPALSPTGQARPFSEDNDGTIIGEGIGMYVLKRLSDAERDGDKIYACINAVGTSSDGKGKAIYAPSPKGQTKVLRRAYEQAGITPRDISYIEAHGTGTGAGDEVEVNALKEVYGNSDTEKPWCAIGSVKSQIGHTKAAAGSAGLIKAALALHHKVIPPTIKVSKPAEALRNEKNPFWLPDKIRPWLHEGTRYAAVSSLGFGGSNYHVVMSEYKPEKLCYDWPRGIEIASISGNSPAEINQALDAAVKAVTPTAKRTWAAQTRQTFDIQHSHRLCFAFDSHNDELGKIAGEVKQQIARDSKSFCLPNGACYETSLKNAPIGVIFPGQGSQYVGMGLDLNCFAPEAFSELAAADAAIGSLDEQGYRLIDRIYPIPQYDPEKDGRAEELLRATDVAQPAIGSVSIGTWRLLEKLGVKAEAFAGHSYGELVSLCAAGAFDSATLAQISRRRGELMASGEGDRGGMIAVAAERKAVEDIIAAEKLDLVVANHNSPTQVVLSGRSDEISRAQKIFKDRKMRGTVLKVAGAFHSSLVADAAAPFYDYLKKLKFAKLKARVYANTTAETYPEKDAEVKKLLGNQLANQVRFVEIIEKMYADGIRTFIEVGPGGKMVNLIKAILEGKEFTVIATDSSAGRRSGIVDCARVIAQLSAMGYSIDLKFWQNGEQWLGEQANKAKPRLTFPVCGANYKSAGQLKVIEELGKPPVKPAVTINQSPNTSHSVPQTSATAAPAPVRQSIQSHVVPQPVQYNAPAQPGLNQAAPIQPSAAAAPESLRLARETLGALQTLQQQTADLHRRFLEGQEQAQNTILSLINNSMPASAGTSTIAGPALQTQFPPAVAFQPAAAQPAFVAERPSLAVQTPVAAAITPTRPVATAIVAPAPAQATNNVAPVLLEVVSEKTGYPSDMLNLEMDMEADLGIDSIKRVEIMSAMQERLPNAPVVQPDQLGKLRTLAQILEHLGQNASTSISTTTMPAAQAQPGVGSATNIAPVLLEVVSEKTGYPSDMLNLEMDMEADLGIDSIKRVEIMSAMQERLPNAPVVQPDQLGKLRTLAQILEHLGQNASASISTTTMPAAPAQPGAGSATNIAPVLLEVVSEKTGYPSDMLNLEMDMEADLGIDSIKRVEIMSAMQERLPNAPVVQPDQLGKLRTLAQILEHLGQNASASISTTTMPAAPAQTGASSATNIVPVLLEVVSEKTGYPSDMLNLEMDMEADLGIDSIKRVEIMSAMQERLPDAPVVQPDQLGKLRTLAQILEHLGQNDAPAPVNRPGPVSQGHINATLLDVVADKTGYPVDMLNPEMDMEADLGIDSIKRVEILSAFQERVPDAPVVQPGDLGNFRTIGQIIEFLCNNAAPAATPASASTSTSTSTSAQPAMQAENKPEPEFFPLKRTVLKTRELSATAEGKTVLKKGDLVVVADDGSDFSSQVCEQFEKRGIKSQKLELAEIAAGKFAPALRGIVILAPQPERVANGLWNEASEEFLKDAFIAVQKAGIAIRDGNGGLIATVSRLDGSFGLENLTRTVDPVQGGLAGLTKTIGHEWPNVTARAIDLDYRFKDTAAAEKLVEELIVAGPLETGLTKASRLTLVEETFNLEENNAASPTFAGDDVIIVTGGARGVTAATAIAMAQKYHCRFALIGRSSAPTEEPTWLRSLTSEPAIKEAILKNAAKKLTPKELEGEFKSRMANREILDNLAEFGKAGSKVAYYSADIRDEKELATVAAQIRQNLGTIIGLIHGAGVLRDRKIEDKTRDQLNDVLDTKVKGLRAVLKALIPDNLKAVILFSSFSGRFGRTGQVDYAMANEVLNKVAHKLRILRPDCRSLSFNWGPWDGGMVTPGLRNLFLAEGIGLIPLHSGARQPIIELSHNDPTAIEIGIIGEIPNQSDKGQNNLQKSEGADTGKKLVKAFDYELKLEANNWLKDHVMNGDAVLPMAVTAEMLIHTAVMQNPGLQFIGYDEMRILKGVVLQNGTKKIEFYSAKPVKSGNHFIVTTEIRSDLNGRQIVNARAEIILAEKLPQQAPAPLACDCHLVYPHSINEAYQRDLFHGDFFKALESVEGWSDHGIAARSRAALPPENWSGDTLCTRWYSDPMAVDAAYQLMILWTCQSAGAPSLPGYAAHYRQFCRNFPENVLIRANTRRIGAQIAGADIDFLDDQGRVLARMEGYECVINEALRQAFKLRSVDGAQK